jgi:uncharacterized protein (TIGR03435 family)
MISLQICEVLFDVKYTQKQCCSSLKKAARHNSHGSYGRSPENRFMKTLQLLFALPLCAQVAPTFEVATIKAAPTITPAMAAQGKFHVGMKMDKAQVDIGYSSIADLIRIAYEVKPYQIAGPASMADKKWDVLAKIPENTPTTQVPRMLQALLAERFGLKARREMRERPVYALVAAPNGAKLKSWNGPDEDKPLQVDTSRNGKSTVVSGGGWGTTRTEMHPDGSMHLESSKMTMGQLADALAYYLDRPVLDMTRLSGAFAVELEFSAADLQYAARKSGGEMFLPPEARAAGNESEPVGASLITSVQKLGLRLERRQAPVETIVVDQVQMNPTEN